MKYKGLNNFFVFFLCALLLTTVAYASLQNDLLIDGATVIKHSSWDIHFGNKYIPAGSIATSDSITYDSSELTIDFTASLKVPGDVYMFSVDIINDGTMDAMLDSFTLSPDSNEFSDFFRYAVVWNNGHSPKVNDLLSKNSSQTLNVILEYRSDISEDVLSSTDKELTMEINMNFIQAKATATPLADNNFSTDSWDVIRNAVIVNPDAYNVGDLKEVDMGSLGKHAVRVANTSTPDACFEDGFSQTACGFVVEFADIITTHNMNSTSTNVGGWPASEMYSYLQNDVFNALPSNLQSIITETYTVSGHGSTEGEDNYTSFDRLYLLSGVEVGGDGYGTSVDSSSSSSRQLDYYSSAGVTSSSYSGAIKNNSSGTAVGWWLRSAGSNIGNGFLYVDNSGDWFNTDASTTYGVSPAFRIAAFQVLPDFASDSWATIAQNVTNNSQAYDVGATKCVHLDGFSTTYDNGCNGDFKVRVANNTMPSECSTEGFSQTACGFVVEFADIITTHNMNSSATNTGGWPATAMRTYVNETIYNALPSDLQGVIADTYTLSGYGSGDANGEGLGNNYASTDKLYLLNCVEVWNYASYDTSSSYTRQLDYYKGVTISPSNYAGAIKLNSSGSAAWWWLRSAYSRNASNFRNVSNYGSTNGDDAYITGGVSPAFRIA